MPRTTSKITRLWPILSLLAVVACEAPPAGPSGMGELQFFASINSPTVSTLAVTVTAADLSDPFVFNFELANGVASGSITVPAGARRTITVRAYDVSGIQTHEGSALVNIRPGPNPAVRITLRPLNGQQPIEVTLGSFTVNVMPAATTLAVGQMLQMQATVRDVDGTVVGGTGDVVWASDAPAVAAVDNRGLVTAHLAGIAQIVASYGGVAAAARITVASSAVYGNFQEFPDASSHGPNFLLGSRITVPQGSTLTHLALIAKAGGPRVMIGLYTDAGGRPGSLIASTPPIPLVVGRMEIAVAGTPLPAGDYWFMAVYDNVASVGLSTADPAAVVRYIPLSFGTPLPAAWPVGDNSYTGQQFNYYLRATVP